MFWVQSREYSPKLDRMTGGNLTHVWKTRGRVTHVTQDLLDSIPKDWQIIGTLKDKKGFVVVKRSQSKSGTH
jgi:hypothetical protein